MLCRHCLPPVALPDKGLVHEEEMEKPLRGIPYGCSTPPGSRSQEQPPHETSPPKGECVCPAWMEPHLSSSERGGKFRLLPQGSPRAVGDSQCPDMWVPAWHLQH